MKKRVKPRWIFVSVLAVALAAVVVFAGARRIQLLHQPHNVPAANTLAAQMVQDLGYGSSYTEVASASIQKYYPIDSSLLAGQGMWLAKDSNNAGELCCFRLRRTADADTVKKVIGERLQRKAQALLGLNTEQYQVVKNAAVVQDGSYLLVAVSGDPAAEAELFKKLLN